MKHLPSKEHYCYEIHNCFFPYMDPLLPYYVPKMSTPSELNRVHTLVGLLHLDVIVLFPFFSKLPRLTEIPSLVCKVITVTYIFNSIFCNQ